jgi:GT2 family glycosyltransferase
MNSCLTFNVTEIMIERRSVNGMGQLAFSHQRSLIMLPLERDAPMIKVSVIIPTFERPGILRNLLTQLSTLRFTGMNDDEIEFIVIDQSSAPYDPLEEITLRSRIRYYHVPEPGLPNARNIGLSAAQGEICAFLDDDVEIDGNFVRAHWKQYEERSVGAVAGRVLEHGSRKRVAGRTPANMYGISLLGRPHPNTGGTTDREVLAFRGCNFSIRRGLIFSIGMFDTRFQPPFLMEESDYAYRIRKAGLRILFSSEACAVHLDHPSGGCRMNDHMKYQSSRFHNAALFFRKNISPAAIPLFVASSLAIGATKAVQHPPAVSGLKQLYRALQEGFASYRLPPPFLQDYLHHAPTPLLDSSLAKHNKVH